MGWRFRKSIKLLPGVRLNFGTKSTSLSIGGKGFHKTFSSTGRVTTSYGIPGTGIYYTESSGGSRTRQETRRPQPEYRETTVLGAVSQPEPYPVINPDDIREDIRNIYRFADRTVDWEGILENEEATEFAKQRAEKILDGDIDTYFQIINDINPLDDLLQYGSGFECGTDDPRKIYIHFSVNSDTVMKMAKGFPNVIYNDLLQDYVCGCSIRIARDMFALLPVRHVIVDALDRNKEILSVDFDKRHFDKLDFAQLDASDTVAAFEHRMDFDLVDGFNAITPLD